MSRKGFVRFFSLLAAGVFIAGLHVSHAAISKTSLRVIRKAPAQLTVVPGFTATTLSTSRIQWSWSTGTFTGSGIDGYKLYSSSTATVMTLSPGASYYIDAGLGVNRPVTRWITSYMGSDQGSDSDHIIKHTYGMPPASVNLDVVVSTGASISWLYSQASAYRVETSTDTGATWQFNRTCFVPPQSIPLLSNKQYKIRLGAVNYDDEVTPGAYSAVANTITPPHTPGFYGVAISSYVISWRWPAAPFAGTGITKYQIFQSTIAEGGIPEDDDTSIVVAKEFTDISTDHWDEVFTSTPTANIRHTRWIKAIGITASEDKQYVQKYTYAIAPSTCGIQNINFENVGDTWANMDWMASGASKYAVEWSTSSDFSVSFSSVIVGSPAYPSTGMTPDSKYDFRVGAINGDNEQTPVNAENPNAYTQTFRFLTRPSEMTTLRSEPVSFTAIKFNWSTAPFAGSAYIDGYSIGKLQYVEAYKKEVIVPVVYISGKDVGEYTLDYLVTNSTHTRYVGAEQSCPGYACFGSLVVASNNCTFATPPNDILFSTVTTHTARLWWKEPEVPPTQYRVERSTTLGEAGPWSFIANASTNSFTDTGLTAETTYTYRIGAINMMGIQTLGMGVVYNGNARDYSFVKSTMTMHVPPSFYGVALSTSAISWNWDTSVNGIQSFKIMTSTGGVLAGALSASTTFWLENMQGANLAFTRVIRSRTARGFSDDAAASCFTRANTPYGLVVTTNSAHGITMNWNGNGCSYYRIDRSPDQVSWSTVKDKALAYAATTYIDTGLRIATTYYYAIIGFNGDGIPAPSSATYSGFSMTGALPSNIELFRSSATTTQIQQASMPGIGNVVVGFPAGSALTDGYVAINTAAAVSPLEYPKSDLDEATGKLNLSHLVSGSIVELHFYDLYGSTQTGNFPIPVRITIPYLDDNGDGVIDGGLSPIPVTSVALVVFDPLEKIWKIAAANPIVDRSAKTISADLQHFSIYALARIVPVSVSLASTIAYPNPYKPGSGGGFDRSRFGEGIVFEPLTPNAKIRIFNIAGELVVDLTEEANAGRLVWDTRNSSGDKVASGLYIYLITNPDNGSDKASGKITIIK